MNTGRKNTLIVYIICEDLYAQQNLLNKNMAPSIFPLQNLPTSENPPGTSVRFRFESTICPQEGPKRRSDLKLEVVCLGTSLWHFNRRHPGNVTWNGTISKKKMNHLSNHHFSMRCSIFSTGNSKWSELQPFKSGHKCRFTVRHLGNPPYVSDTRLHWPSFRTQNFGADRILTTSAVGWHLVFQDSEQVPPATGIPTLQKWQMRGWWLVSTHLKNMLVKMGIFPK